MLLQLSYTQHQSLVPGCNIFQLAVGAYHCLTLQLDPNQGPPLLQYRAPSAEPVLGLAHRTLDSNYTRRSATLPQRLNASALSIATSPTHDSVLANIHVPECTSTPIHRYYLGKRAPLLPFFHAVLPPTLTGEVLVIDHPDICTQIVLELN